jgi:hypothetical protein
VGGNITVSNTTLFIGPLYANGPGTFNSSVGVSGALTVSGSTTLNNVLRMTVASGDATIFNTLAATTLPSYFIYNGTVTPAPALNLPSASSFTGVQLTIKSAGASVAQAEIVSQLAPTASGQLILFGEYVPSQPSTNLGIGEQIVLFSDGTYWIADKTRV